MTTSLRRVSSLVAVGLMACAALPACTANVEEVSETEDAVTKPSLFAVSEAEVDAARQGSNPTAIATVMHSLVSDRRVLFGNTSALRIARMRRLFAGLEASRVSDVRAAFIAKYGADPEVIIRSDGLGKSLLRMSRAEELEMVSILNGASLTETAKSLKTMLRDSEAGTLTQAARHAYFAMLPRIGLWDAPVRAAAGDRSLDALERLALERAWNAEATGVSLDEALKAIEAKLPAADVTPSAPRNRSVAVVASSHGAQWQELMGWAMILHARGYHLQVFTPNGRPVAFQRDSLSVSVATVELGFGAPLDLDPAGHAGKVAAELLGNAAGASSFDAKDYGGVYLAGGLGFNEDVAIAKEGRTGTELTAQADVAKMMQGAIKERLPIVALCHGPTLFAAIPITVNGAPEALNKGIETASLPPFEGFVGATGRKEIQFTYDVNTHHVLEAAGGITHVTRDIKDMHRVVKQLKANIEIITGPGPQAADALAEPTIAAMSRRWGG